MWRFCLSVRSRQEPEFFFHFKYLLGNVGPKCLSTIPTRRVVLWWYFSVNNKLVYQIQLGLRSKWGELSCWITNSARIIYQAVKMLRYYTLPLFQSNIKGTYLEQTGITMVLEHYLASNHGGFLIFWHILSNYLRKMSGIPLKWRRITWTREPFWNAIAP